MFLNKFGVLPMNLQFFSDEGAAPSGANNDGDNAGNQGDQQPTNVGGTQTQQQEGQNQQQKQPEQQPQEKVFTQSDVNNLIAKEKKKMQEKFLKELGIDDFENAKEGFQKFKEWQESQKTEQEKQKELLESLSKEKDSLTSENASLKSQLSALKQGVKGEDVEAVIAIAEKLVDDDTSIDDAIKQVIEKYPQFTQQEKQETGEKPNFTTGQHQKQPQSELDKWLQAFQK